MSARVLNPAMMTEMSTKLSAMVASNATTSSGAGRVTPSRAALARVCRDLFGPVDHVAARALAERELRAQSTVDSERWGFDFRREVPRNDVNSRFEWQPLSPEDPVPEPYALRGMPYLRRQSPPTPTKTRATRSPRPPGCWRRSPQAQPKIHPTERTPPQEPREPDAQLATSTRQPQLLATRKQAAITDFMKSRKRTLSASTKSLVEPPEKVSRNAGQVRS